MDLPIHPSTRRPPQNLGLAKIMSDLFPPHLYGNLPDPRIVPCFNGLLTRHHPWSHAIRKVKTVIRWTLAGSTNFNEMTGRCWQYGRKHNYIVAKLVDVVHSKTRTSPNQQLQPQIAELNQLQFLRKRVKDKYTSKAGLHQPYFYIPGKCEREDAKMLMAAAFFVESEPDQAPQNCLEKENTSKLELAPSKAPVEASKKHEEEIMSPKSTQEHEAEIVRLDHMQKDPTEGCGHSNSPAVNYVDQAMFKMDKWAENWLTGKLGFTDAAWESFELCLSMPDLVEQHEKPDHNVKPLSEESLVNGSSGAISGNNLSPQIRLSRPALSSKRPVSTFQSEIECSSAKRVKVVPSSASGTQSSAVYKVNHNTRCSDLPVTFAPFLRTASRGTPDPSNRYGFTQSEIQGNRMRQGDTPAQSTRGSLCKTTTQSQGLITVLPDAPPKSTCSLTKDPDNTVTRLVRTITPSNHVDPAVGAGRVRMSGPGFYAERTSFAQHRTPGSILPSSSPDPFPRRR